VEANHAGKLKAMYVIGEEMSIVESNANYVSAAFENLIFSLYKTFSSATHVDMPMLCCRSASLEKEGTFHQHGARIQRLYQFSIHRGLTGRIGRSFRTSASSLGARWNISTRLK